MVIFQFGDEIAAGDFGADAEGDAVGVGAEPNLQFRFGVFVEDTAQVAEVGLHEDGVKLLVTNLDFLWADHIHFHGERAFAIAHVTGHGAGFGEV